MGTFVKLFNFLAFNIFTLLTNKSYTKNRVAKYFQGKTSLTHFVSTLAYSGNLVQVTKFNPKLKFHVGKLKKLL